MGVYIKDMEMPKNEPLLVKINPDGSVSTTARNDYRKYEAAPVPPHGDLIDRDALRDNNCDAFEINGADGTILAMDVSIIDDAPAIIPAEEGE